MGLNFSRKSKMLYNHKHKMKLVGRWKKTNWFSFKCDICGHVEWIKMWGNK